MSLYIGGSSDFCGFEFKGVHSSTLGISRVSNNARYDDTVVPNIEDKTMTVPGMTGVYYFDTQYKQKNFNLQIAFDHMTEQQYRMFRQLFNGKEYLLGDNRVLGDLIFDEAPYKAYTAKVMNPPQLKTLCFDEGDLLGAPETQMKATRAYSAGDLIIVEQAVNAQEVNDFSPRQSVYRATTSIASGATLTVGNNVSEETLGALRGRVYKGEGTIQFVAYYPFAHSLSGKKGLNDFPSTGNHVKIYLNKNEWAAASGMLATDPSAQGGTKSNSVSIYNPGDFSADWTAKYNFDSNGSLSIGTISMVDSASTSYGSLTFNQITRKSVNSVADYWLRVNSRTHLVEGLNINGNPTGTIYNEYIASGDFFKIPQTIHYPSITYTFSSTASFLLDYDYLYY